MIYNVYLPAAIRYGIQYDTFMKLNPKIMNVYQQSYIEKIKEKQQEINYSAWLHNQYTLLAVGNAINGKKCKYPRKPFEQRKTVNDVDETPENYKLEMKAMFAKINKGIK